MRNHDEGVVQMTARESSGNTQSFISGHSVSSTLMTGVPKTSRRQ